MDLNQYMQWLAFGPRGRSNLAELVRCHQRLTFARGLLERRSPDYLTELPYETLTTLFDPDDAAGAMRTRLVFERYVWLTDVTAASMRKPRGLPFTIRRLDVVDEASATQGGGLQNEWKCAVS